ncbi:DUF2497 domain-containing protein [Brevundimonas sp. NPDC058933]|uniref:DUF2497 domain-containing protein n=1 Tax=Brevundimonas sp. NPDC058933 TaxID=3346673 RepID=UPI003BEEF315
MTDQTAQEPTMEEILASIRRIISEDDAPAETAVAAPEPVVEVSPEPVEVAAEAPAPVEDEVLELTERYEAPAAESIGDLDVADVAPFPGAQPEPAPEPVATSDYDSLVGESAAASAASAFAGLAATFQKPEAPVAAAPQDLPFVSGNTVEAMVQNMLRPMLKDWLDANLPGIVEAQVRKEVERIARNAG